MGKLKTYRKYDQALRLEAIGLVLEEGHSVRSVERKLGFGHCLFGI